MSLKETIWRPHQKVRPIAVGLLRRGSELLVAAVCRDDGSIKGWRPLGGEIEFGERAADTLTREFDEELGAAVVVGDLLFVLENLFEHEGAKGHEVVFVFEAEFEDRQLYGKDRHVFSDGGISAFATWIAMEDFQKGAQQLYPEGLGAHLESLGQA